MPDALPSCFRGGRPPPSTAACPGLATSIYDTHLGLAALSWSRTVLGLSLRSELQLSPEETVRFTIRPWLLWKRRGSRRLRLRHRQIDVTWDLTRARFPANGGPEPLNGYFVAVAVDGEMLLVAGDCLDEAYRRTKAARPDFSPALISRREHVALREAAGKRTYKTRARFGGSEREITIEIGVARADLGMSVAVDGRSVLHVRWLRWKFRGSERVEVEDGGSRVQISWDLHSWFFQQTKDKVPSSASAIAAASASPELGDAVFVFRFEKEAGDEERGYVGKGGDFKALIGGYFGKNGNCSETSSGGGGGERRKKSLLKTRSSSSSSSASSSASSSTVTGWASPEEAELRNGDGFSLLVYAWKS